MSNREGEPPTDSDSRIGRMKDGRTHLAYKAEHMADLETEPILAAEVMEADTADATSFAHPSDAGGMRRQQVRGLANVRKRYLLAAAGYNLGLVLRQLLGVGKPRGWQGLARQVLEALVLRFLHFITRWGVFCRFWHNFYSTLFFAPC